MNIRITGIRAFSTGVKTKSKVSTVNSCKAIVGEIKRQGHKVNWSPVEPGENLSKYDKTIAFMESISPWGAKYTAGLLYMLYQRSDTIIIFPDSHEKLDIVQKEFARKLNYKNFIFRSPGFLHKDEVWREEKYVKILRKTVEEFSSPIWDMPIYFPALDTPLSDLSELPTVKPITFDPSPIWWEFYDDIEWEYICKNKRWSMAALISAKKWIDKKPFGWDVKIIGDKTLGMKRISERECNEIFASNWGILINEYKHSGCGYVRYKYIIAAKFGCIPYGHEKDFKIIGPTWEWCANNLELIETMSISQLANCHNSIFNEYVKVMWTREQFEQFVNDLLKG